MCGYSGRPSFANKAKHGDGVYVAALPSLHATRVGGVKPLSVKHGR